MSEINNFNISEGKNLLDSIFIKNNQEKEDYYPIINNELYISQILSYINNNTNNIQERIDIVKTLNNIFNKNSALVFFFMKNNINLYKLLIDLYLSEDIDTNFRKTLEQLLKLITNIITANKQPIQYLCQKLSLYFDDEQDKNKKKEILNESKILKYLYLFKIFYNGENKGKNETNIKNFIYFNGIKSSLALNLNKNSINPNTNFPTIQYGLSFIFWIYIDDYLIKSIQEINKKTKIVLVKIDINGTQIELVLKDIYNFNIYFNGSKQQTIQNNLIKKNDWNYLVFSIYEKKCDKLPIILYINSVGLHSYLNITNNFNISTKITSITLFENFIGKVSSLMLITKGLEQQEVNYFLNTAKYGFYKNKILFNFIISNEINYFANCKNYIYYKKYNSNNRIDLYDLHLGKQNIKNLFAIFCPFAYNKDKNILDDIFGNFIGVLGDNDGVNFFKNNSKNIKQLGGINNLLPILELMHSTLSQKNNNNQYHCVDKSILTSKSFYEYLNLIKDIILEKNNNLIDAIDSKFFSSLSIFIQQFPRELFDENILNIFIDIGKEIVKYGDNARYKKENYVYNILLNEKIIINYTIKQRIILWQNLYSFFTSDDTLIKDSFNINKICFLIRLFDSERYNKLCCKKHSDIFNINNNNKDNILSPEMSERIKDLFNIIQLYINKLCDEEDSFSLFKLLSLDISSCVQEKIIDIYFNYFSNKKISHEKKLKSFEILLRNDFIELIEYVYSISLLDIKIKILYLLKILFSKDYSNLLKKHLINDEKFMNNFYIFISMNLLPEQIYTKIDNNNNINTNININIDVYNNNELVPIKNYFNEKIYYEKCSKLWDFLLGWALYKVRTPSNFDKKKGSIFFHLNTFIIDFLISFVSRCPFNYIDLFMMTLNSYFNDISILNREILFSNKNLYHWLIETIFYFHNSELNINGYKKEDIISIQKNSFIVFEDFFIHRRPHEEINKRLYYIIRYSSHLRLISGDINNKKNQEITRITRLLLEKIMDISSIHMNYKAKYCFDFILFHKNYHQITGAKNHISNSSLRMSYNNDVVRLNTNFNVIGNLNLGLNNNIEEENNEDIIQKNNDDFNKININIINTNFNIVDSDSEKNSDSNSLSTKSDIIPEYIFDGLHLNESKNDNEKKEKTLKAYWKDFSLYDIIIDYYSSNIWGIENLRKKVKIELEDGDQLKLYKTLIQEYGENKLYKNILLKEVLKCLTLRSSVQSQKKPKIKVNILHVNIILLCIALVLTKDLDESIFWEGKFIQFILFCILVSININSNEAYFDLIQDNIYDTLGFAYLFMKKKDKKKYNKLIDALIFPLLENNEQKKSKFFGLKKNSNLAVFKLFELRQKSQNNDDDEISNFSKFQKIENFELKNKKHMMIKSQTEFELTHDSIIKDEFKIDLKKNKKVVFKGEKNIILKHLFEDELSKITQEKKEHILFKFNYKNEYNKINFSGDTFNDEKLRVNQIIEKILSFYEDNIITYGDKKFFEEKIKRNKYKKNKEILFSWNGFWSNKYLFLEKPELLKLKIKNHYTKELTKPLLTNILDINYYLPPFKSFDNQKLFDKNNYHYKINLDIDNIFEEEEIIDDIDTNIIKTKDNENNINIYKNEHGFNFLECSYKFQYNNIWNLYQKYYKKNSKYKKLILNGQKSSNIFNSNIMLKHKENQSNIYKCCRVKLTHHIQGLIFLENSHILFFNSSDSDNDKDNDLTFDKDMGCCFGSIFKNKKSDKDMLYTKIYYKEIKFIFLRKYFYMETGLEIFTDNNKSYFFNFKSNKDLIQFKINLLQKSTFIEIRAEDYKGKKVIGYEKIKPNAKKKNISVNKKSEEWLNNNISTMEYLMWLNIYSGRSFNDLTQYPVFPWILMSYSDEKKNEIQFRDLGSPMGMYDIGEKSEKRKLNFIDVYETIKADLKDNFADFNYQDYLKKGDEYFESYKIKKTKKEKDGEDVELIELNQFPYFYGSHYSNPTYVSHYLVRIFPYALTGIEIQGEKFDDPDRIFSSITKTFESATTQKDDVRELVPEFYYLPDLFLNSNNLDLTQNRVNSEGKLILINDVKLPFWSNNNSINFVIKLRRYLESNNINNNLNKWIDLIFGAYQRGEKAEENHNIFQAHTYDRMVKIDKITNIDIRNSLMRQYEMGVTPFQIFESETKSKTKYNSNNNILITLDETKIIEVKFINSNKFNILKNKYYENSKYSTDPEYKEENKKLSFLKTSKITSIEDLKIKIFTNKGHWYEIKIEEEFDNNSKSLKITESTYYKFQNNSNKYACSYKISDIDGPIITYNNNQSIMKGGFWDGRIEINNFNLERSNDITLQVQTIFNPDLSPITSIDYNEKEKLFFCGSIDGNLYIYRIIDYKIEFIKGLYLFNEEITSISVNENLNMLCVCSKDGYINLHILPSFELIRVIYLNKTKTNNNNNYSNDDDLNENNHDIYANNIFLSNYPLPCITIFINSQKIFKSYTINGILISQVKESENSTKLISPIIYTNHNFQDILIYGTNDGFVKIRKFPEMSLINSLEVFPGKEINALCVSRDKKYCYVCSDDNIIVSLKASGFE